MRVPPPTWRRQRRTTPRLRTQPPEQQSPRRGNIASRTAGLISAPPSALKLLVPQTLWACRSKPHDPVKSSTPPHPACRACRDLHPQDTRAIRPHCPLLTPHPITAQPRGCSMNLQHSPSRVLTGPRLPGTAPEGLPTKPPSGDVVSILETLPKTVSTGPWGPWTMRVPLHTCKQVSMC